MHASQGLQAKRHSDGWHRLMSEGDDWTLQPVIELLRTCACLSEACMPAHDKCTAMAGALPYQPSSASAKDRSQARSTNEAPFTKLLQIVDCDLEAEAQHGLL
ncbi:hypothetical protein [Xanthomonas campestris]|uniref:hypothetical protein n=1 Tax=Xanthomonas campestris TaxID=339 RepID=UPI001260D7D0|nr:hypothetical protein [Xanthomonas campestris]MCD0248324.1 hypothetical protein [Xanthomonas campestris pv. campestris]MCD0260721.1 hypothetical protein [Xanthomonas campestris pv. campestris]MCD0269018.1 hypothetical protein [Xanthomonas campestris pv. campestris]MCD0274010.1 hypothetical protein [Xanthomonas campestris pv. campestris]MCF8788300.1 hypothetical protein [Xanthomonas campestris pv. campestris]